ncbi:uncharacterized protein UDID_17808 [Ustilago sp. UG-2017a]|nr:uncharacterized protein UDID_17808 [Ustilago sp. UG-2017a]
MFWPLNPLKMPSPILILIALFLTSLSYSTLAVPVGGSSLEHLADTKRARKPVDDAYAQLETFQNKPVPTSSTLRPPNDHELDDIRGTTSFVRTDETDALGFILASRPCHALTEQLIAVHHEGENKGKLYRYGYTIHPSTGTPEAYKDIAIKLPDGRYLVKDDVPVNRLLYNKMLVSDDWFKHLAAHGDSKPEERQRTDGEKGKVRLGESVEGKV